MNFQQASKTNGSFIDELIPRFIPYNSLILHPSGLDGIFAMPISSYVFDCIQRLEFISKSEEVKKTIANFP